MKQQRDVERGAHAGAGHPLSGNGSGVAAAEASGEKAIPASVLATAKHPPKAISPRKRFLLLAFIMVGACTLAMAAMTVMLYRHEIQKQQEMLQVTAQSQARLMESIARNQIQEDSALRDEDAAYDAFEAALAQIIDAHGHYEGFGKTGELTLARRDGDSIVFVLRHRHGSVDQPTLVAFDSDLAEPMRRALEGLSGTVIGLDYRGETVLASHEPVAVLNLGIVAKIDLSEIRAPFLWSGLAATAVALLVVLAGAVLFFRIGNPIIVRLEAYSRDLEKEVGERKRAEETLRESEERFKGMLANMSNGVAVYEAVADGADFVFVDFNPAAEKINEAAREEVLGKRVSEAFPGVEEFGLLDIFRRVWRTGQAEHFPITLYQDNRIHGWRENFVYKLPSGEIVAIHNDITERKQAEEALRASEKKHRGLTENLPQRIFHKDTNLLYVSCNQHYAQDLGLLPEEIAGKSDFDFYPKELAEKYRVDDRHVMESGQTQEFEESYIRDGRELFVQTVKTPLTDDAGNVTGILGIFWDITERKRAEEERAVHLRFLEKMARVDHAIQQAADAEQMMSDVLQTTLDIFESDRAWLLYPCDPEAASWRVPMERTRPEYPGALAAGEEIPMLPDNANAFRPALATDGPVTVDYPSPETTAKIAKQFSVLTEIYMAVYPRTGKPWLFGMHQCSHHRDWTGEEKELFREIGHRLGDGLSSLLFLRGLRESEEHYRRITAAVTDYIYTVRVENGQAVETTHGEACLAVTGYTPEEFRADRYLWINMVREEDRERVRQQAERVLRGEDVESLEHRILRKDGQECWVINSVVPAHDSEGRLLSYDGLIQDITGRKRAEEALLREKRLSEEYINSLPGLFYVFDEQRLVRWNKEWNRVTDYSDEELAGGYAKDFFEGEDQARIGDQMLEVFQKGTAQARAELVTKDGRHIPYFFTGRRTIINGKDHLVGLGTDITEREKLEAQLRQAQKMEAIGQLAGGVAHDFNNLLQAILGYGDLALDDAEAGSPVRASIEEMLDAGRRAKTLVSQLLAFSRRQVLEMQDVNLNDVITDLMKMIRRVIGEHITLDVIAGPDLGNVRADPGQIEQILLNLCVNARDAMPEGGRICIGTENVRIDEAYSETHAWAEAGRYALLSVTDTGCGMDKTTLGQVFEPFFTTKDVGQGTGLGLATVYGLVKQHQGMVYVYSEVGKGTAFKIYLPLVERSATAVDSTIEAPVLGGTETILLAEDDATIRKLTRTILEHAGYTVLAAADGEEALRVFDEHADEIGLALLDVIMPKLGGRAVFERIRETHPTVRVLFTSGYSMNAIHTDFVLEEGLQLIQKPCQRDDLLRKVRACLDAAGSPSRLTRRPG